MKWIIAIGATAILLNGCTELVSKDALNETITKDSTTQDSSVIVVNSSEGDSLALVAIKKANPGSIIDTLTGEGAWDTQREIRTWSGVYLDRDGRVEQLYLKGCKLRSIPSEIQNLRQLITLMLDSNQLAALPETIGNLKYLQSLNLSHNSLENLPASIGNLMNLSSLTFDNNTLRGLPSKIASLPCFKVTHGEKGEMVEINLSHNEITENSFKVIAGELKGITNLSLNLSFNRIEKIPSEVGQLVQMTSIDLSNNVITSIPAEIGQLESLEYFYLSNNQLASIPAEISNIANRLQVLHLNDNNLKSLPNEFGQLTNLQALYLHNNQLESLPESITAIKSIRSCQAGVGHRYFPFSMTGNSLKKELISQEQIDWLNGYNGSYWTSNGTIINYCWDNI